MSGQVRTFNAREVDMHAFAQARHACPEPWCGAGRGAACVWYVSPEAATPKSRHTREEAAGLVHQARLIAGYEHVVIPDGRRGLWARETHAADGALVAVELRLGREGDDSYFRIEQGVAIDIQRFASDVLASLRFASDCAFPYGQPGFNARHEMIEIQAALAEEATWDVSMDGCNCASCWDRRATARLADAASDDPDPDPESDGGG